MHENSTFLRHKSASKAQEDSSYGSVSTSQMFISVEPFECVCDCRGIGRVMDGCVYGRLRRNENFLLFDAARC